MTSAQCRAGRALLGWSAAELAERAGVHRNTVVRLEAGGEAGHAALAIRVALEAAGVVLLPENGGGAGVRLAKPGAGDDRSD